MKKVFTIITYKEWDFFIGKILENNISSFGKTEKEAYNNTKEALELYLEDKTEIEKIEISSPKIYSLSLENA